MIPQKGSASDAPGQSILRSSLAGGLRAVVRYQAMDCSHADIQIGQAMFDLGQVSANGNGIAA